MAAFSVHRCIAEDVRLSGTQGLATFSQNIRRVTALLPPRSGRSGDPAAGVPDPYGSRFSRPSTQSANRRLQSKQSPVTPPWEWVALAGVLVAAVVVRAAWLDFHLDDSYITYTYARSLASGDGLTFNGAKVLGTTTPLYAMVLALLGALGFSIPAAATALGLIGSLVGCSALYLLAREPLGKAAGIFAAALLALNGVHASMSMSGMETGIYTGVCLSALLAHRKQWPRVTALLAAAACLLRPDGILLTVVLALAAAWERRSEWRRSAVYFAAPLVLWILIATVTYGSPIPTSVSAKLAYPDYGHFTFTAAMKAVGNRLGTVVLWLSAFGLWELYRRAKSLLPLIAWTALYLLAFLRAPNFAWYYAPIIPGLIALGVAGLVAVVRLIPRERLPSPVQFAVRVLAVVGAVAALFVVSEDRREQGAVLTRTHGREVAWAYRSLGEWLHDHTPEDAVVATPEVGYMAYYGKRRILDLAGLCSPELIPYLRRRAYANMVRDRKPDFVVLTTEGGRTLHRTILTDPDFKRHHVEKIRFPYRGAAYVIFARK